MQEHVPAQSFQLVSQTLRTIERRINEGWTVDVDAMRPMVDKMIEFLDALAGKQNKQVQDRMDAIKEEQVNLYKIRQQTFEDLCAWVDKRVQPQELQYFNELITSYTVAVEAQYRLRAEVKAEQNDTE